MTPWLRRSLSSPLLPIAVAVVVLLLATMSQRLAPRGPLGDPWLIGVAALLAAAAGLHRPLGGAGLGIGTIVLPAVFALWGAVPGALVAGAAWLILEFVYRWLSLRGPNPPPERRRLLRGVETAACGAISVLAAGSAWALVDPLRPLDLGDSRLFDAASASAATFLLFELGWRWIAQQRYRPRDRSDLVAHLIPLSVDLGGWWAGIPLAVVASRLGAPLAGALAAALVVASLEAFRTARLLALSRQRANEIEEVSRAGQRVTAGGGELALLAESVRHECEKLVHFRYFQFELVEDGGAVRSWMAESDGPLREGVPQPERHVPAVPGIHRRRGWKVLDYPLEAQGKVLANLRLWCDPRRLETAEVELLEALREQLASSVHRALLDRDAKLDPLTGVAVRRVLERQIDPIFERCVDEGGAMAVVLCDLDHFKKINDTYGHGTGDRALQLVARVLARRVKQSDLCCRYGGEEFVLLLPDADGATGLVVAERLRYEVEQLELETDDGRERITLTMSAGVAAFPDLYVSAPRELLALADAALYEAKRRGRNLCLLDLGRGRYRDARGRVHTRPESAEPPEPPRLFA